VPYILAKLSLISGGLKRQQIAQLIIICDAEVE
jgi:hypothetical protein